MPGARIFVWVAVVVPEARLDFWVAAVVSSVVVVVEFIWIAAAGVFWDGCGWNENMKIHSLFSEFHHSFLPISNYYGSLMSGFIDGILT